MPHPEGGRFRRYCERHAFKPFSVILSSALILLLAAAVLYLTLVSLSTSQARVSSRMTNFGLRDVGELVTQEGYFTNVQKINDARKIGNFEVPFTQSKYIYCYDGVVKAGLDFSQIEVIPDDEKHTVTIRLPEIRILSCEISEDSFELFDETKNIFTPLKLNDVNRSLAALKEEVREKAIANGLLEAARKNAELMIKVFLSSAFDFNVYSIQFE